MVGPGGEVGELAESDSMHEGQTASEGDITYPHCHSQRSREWVGHGIQIKLHTGWSRDTAGFVE